MSPPCLTTLHCSKGGYWYDPIHHDSKQKNNVELNTIYDSPGLCLVSVTMYWGVALKLLRYQKQDPEDITAMLLHGTNLNTVKWTPKLLKDWVEKLCWPMGYQRYGPKRQEQLEARVRDAVARWEMARREKSTYSPIHIYSYSSSRSHIHDLPRYFGKKIPLPPSLSRRPLPSSNLL